MNVRKATTSESRCGNEIVSACGNYGVASIILEKNIFGILYRVPDRMTSFELTAHRIQSATCRTYVRARHDIFAYRHTYVWMHV